MMMCDPWNYAMYLILLVNMAMEPLLACRDGKRLLHVQQTPAAKPVRLADCLSGMRACSADAANELNLHVLHFHNMCCLFAFLEDHYMCITLACLQDNLVPCSILCQHLANRCAQPWTRCSLTLICSNILGLCTLLTIKSCSSISAQRLQQLDKVHMPLPRRGNILLRM